MYVSYKKHIFTLNIIEKLKHWHFIHTFIPLFFITFRKRKQQTIIDFTFLIEKFQVVFTVLQFKFLILLYLIEKFIICTIHILSRFSVCKTALLQKKRHVLDIFQIEFWPHFTTPAGRALKLRRLVIGSP